MKLTQENERVILYFNYSDHKALILKKDEVYHSNKGMIKHNDLINQPFGKELEIKNNKFYILPENRITRIENDKRKTQIIFESDTSLIINYLNLKNHSTVIECGTGSGVLTQSFSELVQEGKVFSYEIDEERYLAAKEKFTNKPNITIHHCDADIKGFLEQEVDAVFLDMGSPYNSIRHAYNSLNEKGILCVFVPTFNQVSLSLKEMNNLFTNIRMFEFISKKYSKSKFKNDIFMNDNLYYHTGYLIFGNK
ncbi:tRNA (adenine(58)-N(1))-methyltransferase [Tubulinosema ratisbonensis]|uniref:tRNA (adenine(58)-N(1))-methyltransferase catalytic subunit TRM61 n=1 Tax=Tubulinosema ratisbonensis TaxID=291195 RepID=A0A437APN5_9MICR|nr:tRNA (adenine(58)-N(1))-methyltransferase [Tubulinosema ratisbonensis]